MNLKPQTTESEQQQKVQVKHRPIFGNRLYLTHPETKHGSIPVLNPLNTINPNNGDKPQVSKQSNEIPVWTKIADSCTQTSKTILQLAKIEADNLSPDSLMQSPREPQLSNAEGDEFETLTEVSAKLVPTNSEATDDSYTLDGSFEEQYSSVTYTRKNDVENYLHNVQPDQKVNLNQNEGNVAAYNEKSLTKAFLEKKQNDTVLSAPTCDCRSFFLQQTSPLRNLNKAILEKCEGHFKSKSYIESYGSDFTYQNDMLPPNVISHQNSRFTIKSVQHQNARQKPESLRCLWIPPKPENNDQNDQNLALYRRSPKTIEQSRRNSTFMSPTFASEQRNQQHKVKKLVGLISPTKRGKSLSPSRHPQSGTNLPRKFNAEKIPYIDRSNSTVEMCEPLGGRGIRRKNLSRRDGSPTGLISPLTNNLKFDEDLLRIDLQSLELKTSGETITESARPSCSASTTSSDNVISVILSHIRDPDWSTALKGLAEMTELCCIMDPDLIYPHMTTVNQRLLQLLRSPRSHVCKTACQAAGHFFESIKDTRRPGFDDIVENLLHKAADANKFIRTEANLALDCMVTHIPIFHCVRALCLKGPTHKNPLVRTATIRLIVCAVVICGADILLNLHSHEHTRKRVIQYMAKFLQDRDQETRKYAERLYKILAKEPNFDSCLKKYLEKDEITNMKTVLCKNRNM